MRKYILLLIVLIVSLKGYCQVPFVEYTPVPNPTPNYQRQSQPIFETPRTTNVYIQQTKPNAKITYDEVEKVEAYWVEKDMLTKLSIRVQKYSDGSIVSKVLGYEYNGKMIIANHYAVEKLSDLMEQVPPEMAEIFLNAINDGITTTIQINDFNFFL